MLENKNKEVIVDMWFSHTNQLTQELQTNADLSLLSLTEQCYCAAKPVHASHITLYPSSNHYHDTSLFWIALYIDHKSHQCPVLEMERNRVKICPQEFVLVLCTQKSVSESLQRGW